MSRYRYEGEFVFFVGEPIKSPRLRIFSFKNRSKLKGIYEDRGKVTKHIQEDWDIEALINTLVGISFGWEIMYSYSFLFSEEDGKVLHLYRNKKGFSMWRGVMGVGTFKKWEKEILADSELFTGARKFKGLTAAVYLVQDYIMSKFKGELKCLK